jgi:hypothetical protein
VPAAKLAKRLWFRRSADWAPAANLLATRSRSCCLFWSSGWSVDEPRNRVS